MVTARSRSRSRSRSGCGVTAGGEGDKGPVGLHDSRRGARWSVRAAHHHWDRLLVANGRQGESLYTVRRAAGDSLHGNMIRVFTASTVSRPNALDAVEGLGGFHHVRLLVRCISDAFPAAHYLSSTRASIRARTRALRRSARAASAYLTT